MLGPQITHSAINALLAVGLMAQLVSAALDGHCPPLGPILPAPRSPTASGAVQEAIYKFQDDFNNITASCASSAVSVSVQSIHELDRLLDLHYTPPTRGPGSTDTVDANTVYRIASISKVFTTLGILREGIGMGEAVLGYLPELSSLGAADGTNNDITAVDWYDVTIGSLASHMSGVGLDCKNLPHKSSHKLPIANSTTCSDE